MAEAPFWEPRRKVRRGSALLQAGLFVLGVALFAFYGNQRSIDGPPQERLVAVPATLLSASCEATGRRVRREPLPDDAANAVVRFDYVFDGHPYQSTRYQRGPGAMGTMAACAALIGGLRQQPTVQAWVDPAWPHFAVLSKRVPDTSWLLGLAGFGGALALLGGYRLWRSFRPS